MEYWNAQEGITFGDQYNGRFEIYTTSDGGTAWTPVPAANIPPALTNEFIYPKSNQVIDSVIWITTTKGRLFKSIDRGMHWNVNTIAPGDFVFASFQSDKLHGIAATPSMSTYKTTDGGNTWAPYSYSGPMYFIHQSIPGTNYYVSAGSYLTTPIGSSYSIDGGVTWTEIDSVGRGTSNGYFWLTFLDINTGYATGFTQSPTSGGIYKWDAGVLGIKEKSLNKSLAVYPNPGTDKITVQGVTPGSMIQVINMSGSVLLKDMARKKNEVIDVSSYPTALYLIQTGSRSTKFVKE